MIKKPPLGQSKSNANVETKEFDNSKSVQTPQNDPKNQNAITPSADLPPEKPPLESSTSNNAHVDTNQSGFFSDPINQLLLFIFGILLGFPYETTIGIVGKLKDIFEPPS